MNLCRIASKTVNELFIKELICTNHLPSRNTFIVSRVSPPPRSRKDAPRPRILKRRHFLYKTVEDTDLTYPPDLHVVLTSFVDGIGEVGDVISVDAFFARESLLLPRKAEYATIENIKKYAHLKKARKETPKYSSIHAGMMVRNLSKIVIPIFMNDKHSWTIEKNHVHVAFRIEGFNVPENAIELPATPIQGPDPVKEGTDFAVTVIINNMEKVSVRCRIFHFKPGLESAKLTEEFYLEKGEPALEEQKELLETMPEPEIINDPSANISLVEKYRIQYIK